MKSLILLLFLLAALVQSELKYSLHKTLPPLPIGPPQPAPTYAKNHVNKDNSAPVNGMLNGPVLSPLNSSSLAELHHHDQAALSISHNDSQSVGHLNPAMEDEDDFWLASLGAKGSMPLAPSGYEFFRNVKDWGAVGDGVTDDTIAINRAAAAMSRDNLEETRCEDDCGSTSTLAALVYFPPGTYLVSTPIVQYYHTQFVGNPTWMPSIKGAQNFTGIALVDSNVYIPGEDGKQWYINQSNFYRQIRNLVFDLRGMPNENWDNNQNYVPTGIHWQVGQATSITNCTFLMDIASEPGDVTAVGIMMENGSGGSVHGLSFDGGNIGFIAGSQQFTATDLRFYSCLTPIKQTWNWGFLWKNLFIESSLVGIDCTDYSQSSSQGVGSISVIDSTFSGVPTIMAVRDRADQQPNIVLDNVVVDRCDSVIATVGGDTILDGASDTNITLNSWALGYQCPTTGSCTRTSGFIDPTTAKPGNLLNSQGDYYVRPRPNYESAVADGIIVVTDLGVKNDGTGDQASTINTILEDHVGEIIYFPAGIYMVGGTVKIPNGSIIVGSGWSQIMGFGWFFEDAVSPQVMVQVGSLGDVGSVEISDFLFTVKGATSGCILMQWNIYESMQGSAAMWDSHFRVGGATGTDLQLENCPTKADSVDFSCMAAAVLMHVTKWASGYFDNVWLWVADHDLDNDLNSEAFQGEDGIPTNVLTQVSVYVGRGLLVESQGPTWFYGTSSEHSQMYQYQLNGASNIFMGHMQTETPYYQPNPDALQPYTPAHEWVGDPFFGNCATESCKSAWALRVIDSKDIVIFSAGLYSFFQNNDLGCTDSESCQTALLETGYSQGLWLYNVFTKGSTQIITPRGGGLSPLFLNDTTRIGYTSEVATWLVLALEGEELGSDTDESEGGSGDVYVDPGIWSSSSVSMSCSPPCTYILPPLTLSSPTTITFPPSTTSLEVGWMTETTFVGGDGSSTSTDWYVSVTVTTTFYIPALTTSVISMSNVPIVSGENSSMIYPQTSLVPPPFIITDDPDPESNGESHSPVSRTITPQPWPWTTWSNAANSMSFSSSVPATSSTILPPPITIVHTSASIDGPTCTGNCGRKCTTSCDWPPTPPSPSNNATNTTTAPDCFGAGCIVIPPCSPPSTCTRGGACAGPSCKRGGSCTGPNCLQGGDCFGIGCEAGGSCTGPLCLRGGICKGPISCPPGPCFGPYCGSGGQDSGAGGGPPNNPNIPPPVNGGDGCTSTGTFSSCRTLCTQNQAEPTQDCTSTCRDVVGCEETGSITWASTVTPAPVWADVGPGLDFWSPPGPNDAEMDGSAALGALSMLVTLGDFGANFTSTSGLPSLPHSSFPPAPPLSSFPPRTTTTSFPTPSTDALPTGTQGEPYCFYEHEDPDETELRFKYVSPTMFNKLVYQLCYNSGMPLLMPDNEHGWGYVQQMEDESGVTEIVIYVSWAESQEGCNPRQPTGGLMVLGDHCLRAFWALEAACDGNGEHNSLPGNIFGGSYVENTADGCVQWYFGADNWRLGWGYPHMDVAMLEGGGMMMMMKNGTKTR